MLLRLDIASVKRLQSHVNIIPYRSLPSRHRPGISSLPLLRCRGGYDLQISYLSFLSLLTTVNLSISLYGLSSLRKNPITFTALYYDITDQT